MIEKVSAVQAASVGELGDLLAAAVDRALVERLAELVVAELVEHESMSRLMGSAELGSAKLLTVGQVAELLGVPRDFVYRHKEALGVIRLPSEGARGRLRFDRDTLRDKLRADAVGARRRVASAGRRRSEVRSARPPAGDLLPVRPRQVA